MCNHNIRNKKYDRNYFLLLYMIFYDKIYIYIYISAIMNIINLFTTTATNIHISKLYDTIEIFNYF